MTTNELKSYVNRILGNNMRLLLPSYWWKRAFGAVIDNTVSADSIKTINGESVIGEGDLRVGVKNVESVEALESLDAELGDIATVGTGYEGVSFRTCRNDNAQTINDTTRVLGVEISKFPEIDGRDTEIVFYNAKTENSEVSIRIFSTGRMDGVRMVDRYVDTNNIYIFSSDGKTINHKEVEAFNKLLQSGDYRFYPYKDESIYVFLDTFIKCYIRAQSADAYIKADSWDKLAKEIIVSSESELNALDVPNGTIAKVAKGGKTVGSFNDLAVGDRVTDVEFMQPPYASGSCSVMFKDKDGNDIGFGVDSNGTECQFGLVTRKATIIFGNENGIDQDLYDQAITIFKESECTFEWVEGKLPVDSFVRPITNTPIISDAYIKGETWKRLLKEGDTVGSSESVLFVSPLSEGKELTEDEKAINAESYRKIVDGFNDGHFYDVKIYGVYATIDATIIGNPLLTDGLKLMFMIASGAWSILTVMEDGSATLEEGDVTGGGESCSCIEEVIFYAADNVRGYTLTAEEKAKNVEAYNKQYQAYHDKTPLNRIVCVRGDVTLFMPVTYFIPAVSTNGTTLNVIKSGGLDEFYINVSYDGSATYSEKKGLDEALSTTSRNPVQNKVITSALNEKASIAYVDEKVANISSEEGLEYRKLYAKGDALGIVTGELTSEQKAYNIETINLYKQNKAIIGYEQVIGGINRINLCKGTDSNGEATNFYFAHVLNASVLISIAISADGSGTYQSDNGLLIDSELSETSENAVQNKVVTTALIEATANITGAFNQGMESLGNDIESLGNSVLAKADKTYVDEKVAGVDGANLKTINGVSLRGEGNIELHMSEIHKKLQDIIIAVLNNEEVFAAAINDINRRLLELENSSNQ